MKKNIRAKVTVDSSGDFRCVCCGSVLSQEKVISFLKKTLGEDGKEIFKSISTLRKYLLKE
jgi:hypothetical protein